MDNRWEILQLSEEQLLCAQQLSRELKISPHSAHMLVARGLYTAEAARAFIRPSLDELHDPFLMRDMNEAVERLHRALQSNERIMVYGDYDVDGTTAVALMFTYLKKLTQNIEFYIPDRYTEGYGISFRGIDVAQDHGCTLIIALDCGIKSLDKVTYATERGIDFIICDHHTPGEDIPKAVAVLNMKRQDCPYPYKELSGCGVGFKLIQAYSRYIGIAFENLMEYLPLTAMAIASDIVPVTGENRILAYYGLRALNHHPSVGIRAIIQVAGLGGQKVTIHNLGYRIGPRINACGRMKSGAEAVELLITTDEEFAAEQAKAIENFNMERREADTQTTEEALQQLRANPDNDQLHTSVVYAPHWHKGVVGIAASRLTETYYRPTIVLTTGDENNDIISGSARSAGGFDIYSAIDSCHELLTNFGGHKYAAGLSMHKRDLETFKQRFEAYVAEHITEGQQQPSIEIEDEIELQDITPQFYNIIRHLEPFGPGNPRPVFVTRHLINNRYTKRVGKQGEHLKLDVTDRTAAISGIAFGKGDLALHLQNGHAVDVVYELDENTFNGQTTLQMMAADVKPIEN